MFSNVYPREKYLARIRPFYDSDIIKVITGIRRCGKSFILKAIMNELYAKGITESMIIYIPLDKRGFKSIKTRSIMMKNLVKILALLYILAPLSMQKGQK